MITKNHGLLKNIKLMLAYIENNTQNNITINDCANIAHVSKFYLAHLFKKTSGLTVMEYVQLRKLSKSIMDLKMGVRIIDIALKYGFKHEQSYIRAFKRAFGTTPGKYRKEQIELNIVHPINLQQCFQAKNGLLISPKTVYVPSLHLVGIKHNLTGQNNLANNTAKSLAHDFYYNHSKKITNAVNPKVYYGYTWHDNKDLRDNNYMPALEVVSANHIPQNMSLVSIVNQNYCVFSYIGNHSVDQLSIKDLMDLHNYIDNIFTVNHNYDFVKQGGFFFEKINMSLSANNYCEVELYYPIQ